MASTELPSLKAETERIQSKVDMVRDRYVDTMWEGCKGDKKCPHPFIFENLFFEALFPMSKSMLCDWKKQRQQSKTTFEPKLMATVCVQSAYEVLDDAPTDLEMVVLLSNVLSDNLIQDIADVYVKMAHGYAIEKGVWTKTT